jgi:predicted PurR-regulated permease PerM
MDPDERLMEGSFRDDADFRLRMRRTLIYYSMVIVGLVFLAYLYQAVLGALLISLLLVYLLQPLIQNLVKRGMKQIWADVLVVGGLFIGLGVILASLLPALYRQGLVLSQLVPKAMATISTEGSAKLTELLLRVNLKPEALGSGLMNPGSLSAQVREYLSQGISGVIDAGSLVLSGIVTLSLIPILTIFVLLHLSDLQKHITALTPPSLVNSQKRFVAQIDHTMRAVIQGQLLVSLTLGLLYMLGFSLIGIKASLIIGLICGICRLIPYLDILAAVVLCSISIATNFEGWPQVLGFLLVVFGIQALDGVIITPKILGNRVGLHPVLVIASVISFGSLFGLIGVLVAIPLVALAKVMISQFLPSYLRFIRHVG